MAREYKFVPLTEFKALDTGNGGLEGYLARFGNVDDGGDRIHPGAFAGSLDEFKASGWQALNHDWDALPIGFVDEAVEDATGLFVRFLYHSHQAAQDARTVAKERMTAGKTVGLSIGYEILPGGALPGVDGARRELVKLALYEGSQVNAAMNRDAMATSVKGAPMNLSVKKAIPSHKTETTDAAWDGPAQVANLSNDDGAAEYRQMYAWVDPSSDPDTKSAYKLPHHQVASGGAIGAANVKGCIAGIAVLNGGRGGASIPDADRRGVYNHLKRHLLDAGVDVPDLKSGDVLEYQAVASELVRRGVSLPMARKAKGYAILDIEALGRMVSPTA